jgi:hypothetical protein
MITEAALMAIRNSPNETSPAAGTPAARPRREVLTRAPFRVTAQLSPTRQAPSTAATPSAANATSRGELPLAVPVSVQWSATRPGSRDHSAAGTATMAASSAAGRTPPMTAKIQPRCGPPGTPDAPARPESPPMPAVPSLIAPP